VAWTVHRFAPGLLGVYAEPVDASKPERNRPLKASDVMARAPRVGAALNGSMFDYCPGQPHDYVRATCDKVEYLTRDKLHRSLDVRSSYAGRGMTISVTDGRATAHAGASAPATAPVAIQLYPALVTGGRDVTNPQVDVDRTWRSAMGIDRQGRIVFLVGQGSMTDLAQELIRLGVVDAGYTDGGGSTRLALRGRPEVGHSENRKVPLWIVAEEQSFVRKNRVAIRRSFLAAASVASVAMVSVLWPRPPA
jgi:hypothetical protein